MDLSAIRILCEKREGGLRKLASYIGMSEANLHRCVNNNRIQASDLENISNLLSVDIRLFFDENTTLQNNTIKKEPLKENKNTITAEQKGGEDTDSEEEIDNLMKEALSGILINANGLNELRKKIYEMENRINQLESAQLKKIG